MYLAGESQGYIKVKVICEQFRRIYVNIFTNPITSKTLCVHCYMYIYDQYKYCFKPSLRIKVKVINICQWAQKVKM